MEKARITAIGSYLPSRVLTNQDLEQMVETSDEWIVSRTGIKERRIAAPDEASSDLAYKAAKVALKKRGLDPKDVDLIIVATTTPDHPMPSAAALVQAKLGANEAAAFDLQAACTGFLYALSTAKAFIESGMYKNVLTVAVDKVSSFVDYTDRNTCVLFGDAASAAIVEGKGAGLSVDSIQLGADGELSHLIMIPAGGSRYPATEATVKARQHNFQMVGKEVFKHAIRRMGQAAETCLESVNLGMDAVSWLVPHQANARILEALGKRFTIPEEKIAKTVHKYGNTSAPSVAVTLDELLVEKAPKKGEHLLLLAFGAGLTWGAAVLTVVE